MAAHYGRRIRFAISRTSIVGIHVSSPRASEAHTNSSSRADRRGRAPRRENPPTYAINVDSTAPSGRGRPRTNNPQVRRSKDRTGDSMCRSNGTMSDNLSGVKSVEVSFDGTSGGWQFAETRRERHVENFVSAAQL